MLRLLTVLSNGFAADRGFCVVACAVLPQAVDDVGSVASIEGVVTGTTIDSSPTGTGAVSYVDVQARRFFWVARSLTLFFEIQVAAFRARALLWDEDWQTFETPLASRYEIGGKQVSDYNEGEIERKDLGRFGIWRWSD